MAPRGRAPRGSGYIKQRSAGWFVRRSEIVDGQRRTWYDGPYETKQEATRSAPVPASHRQTVDAGEWITEWAQLRAEQLRSRDRHSSAEIVECHVRLHLAPNLKGIKLGEVRPSHVSALIERLNSTGRIHRAGAAIGSGGGAVTRYPTTGRNARTLSPRTIRNIMSTLSSAMRTAVNDDLLRPSAASSDHSWSTSSGRSTGRRTHCATRSQPDCCRRTSRRKQSAVSSGTSPPRSRLPATPTGWTVTCRSSPARSPRRSVPEERSAVRASARWLRAGLVGDRRDHAGEWVGELRQHRLASDGWA